MLPPPAGGAGAEVDVVDEINTSSSSSTLQVLQVEVEIETRGFEGGGGVVGVTEDGIDALKKSLISFSAEDQGPSPEPLLAPGNGNGVEDDEEQEPFEKKPEEIETLVDLLDVTPSNGPSVSFSSEVATVLKNLEEAEEGGSDPSSIVRAAFVDFSPSVKEEPKKDDILVVEDVDDDEDDEDDEEEEEEGVPEVQEFGSLNSLNPDLPKLRAQQVQNWLEFEKDSNKAEFDMDSLVATPASTESSSEGLGHDAVLTDADGMQRRVRFLTDAQGNILISVFLTKLVLLFFAFLKTLRLYLPKSTTSATSSSSSPPTTTTTPAAAAANCLDDDDGGADGDDDEVAGVVGGSRYDETDDDIDETDYWETDSDQEFSFCDADSEDGEEEEQQQVIHLGADGMSSMVSVAAAVVDGGGGGAPSERQGGFENFPEIETHLAAFVSKQQKQQQQQQQAVKELVDTDKILKELGVAKDNDEEEEEDAVDPPPPLQPSESVVTPTEYVVVTKKVISVDPAVFENGKDEDDDEEEDEDDDENDDVGSDTETMSTSSCSSMIEVKPKDEELEVFQEKMDQIVKTFLVDENNNDVEPDETVGTTVTSTTVESCGVTVTTTSISTSSVATLGYDETKSSSTATAPTLEDLLLAEDQEGGKPKLIHVQKKVEQPCPSPPPSTPIVLSSGAVVVKENGTTFATPSTEFEFCPVKVHENEHEHEVQVGAVVPQRQHQQQQHTWEEQYDEEEPHGIVHGEEMQLESLRIEEEPISAVALTIAKWESFSKKQQQAAAEAGAEGKSLIGDKVKGLGKLILPPMYSPVQQNESSKSGGSGCSTPVRSSPPPLKIGVSNGSRASGPNSPRVTSPLANNNSTAFVYGNGGGRGSKGFSPPCKNGNGVSSIWNNGNGVVWPPVSSSSSSSRSSASNEDEEAIYAHPNTNAGSLNISTSSSNPSSILKSYPKPNSKGEIVNWFKEGEIHRSGILLSYGQTNHHPHISGVPPVPSNNSPVVVSWFFGLITRQQAEEMLRGQPNGTFLVRISTRIWGYTLSYQLNNKTKHFLISAINPAVPSTLSAGVPPGDTNNTSPPIAGKHQMLFPFSLGGRYAFIGTNMTPYTTLTSLIRHHSHAPITKAGGERLLTPCPGGPKISGIEYVFK